MKNLLLLFVLVGLISCKNYTPFTKALYEQHGWSDEELHRIQFYLSDPITLRRELTGASGEIIHGDIKVIDGRKVEVVTIPKKTPGVLEFTRDGDQLAIRFEDGHERYLMFGPNPRYGHKYMLLASEWSRHEGKVHYEGQIYKATNTSQLASLLVDLKKTGRTELRTRRAGGVKVR